MSAVGVDMVTSVAVLAVAPPLPSAAIHLSHVPMQHPHDMFERRACGPAWIPAW